MIYYIKRELRRFLTWFARIRYNIFGIKSKRPCGSFKSEPAIATYCRQKWDAKYMELVNEEHCSKAYCKICGTLRRLSNLKYDTIEELVNYRF